MQPEAASLIKEILDRQVSATARDWVQSQISKLQENPSLNRLHLAFGAAPRWVGKEGWTTEELDRRRAAQLRSGLDISRWTLDEACRIFFLMQLPITDAESHKAFIFSLFDTADLKELAAIFKSLPLLPFPEQYTKLAAEGVRTNMLSVLEAVALDNPYPSEVLDEGAWNQLYLKVTFTQLPIYRIVGVDDRRNAELARIVSDFAHERWSAGRDVMPEIWRVVSPFVNEAIINDLKRLFTEGDNLEQMAAVLVCREAETPSAETLLAQHSQLVSKAGDAWTWERIGRAWHEAKAQAQ